MLLKLLPTVTSGHPVQMLMLTRGIMVIHRVSLVGHPVYCRSMRLNILACWKHNIRNELVSVMKALSLPLSPLTFNIILIAKSKASLTIHRNLKFQSGYSGSYAIAYISHTASLRQEQTALK